MRLVQGARKEPILPHVTAASVEPIDILSVELIRAFQGAGQRVLAARRHNKMDVIGHQTVAIDRQVKTLRRLSQKGQEHPTVFIHKEDVLLVVAPLSNVMSTPFDYYSRTSRHDPTITAYSLNVNR